MYYIFLPGDHTWFFLSNSFGLLMTCVVYASVSILTLLFYGKQPQTLIIIYIGRCIPTSDMLVGKPSTKSNRRRRVRTV